MSIPLYHFSCDHGAEGIRSAWLVRANWQPLLGVTLSWWTDLPEPKRDQVGLTSETFVKCDRLAHRFIALPGQDIERWLGSWMQARISPRVQAYLHRYGDPGHWWIARKDIRVEVSDE